MASLLQKLKGLLRGLVFIFYLYFTTFFGSIFIMGPAYPLLIVKQNWFRRYQDFWLGIWLWLPGSLIELFGTKLVITGDNIDPASCPLIIMNHRCRLDWMFYWMGLQRYGRLSHEKIIMKHELKLIPGPGWAMQNGMFAFLKRRWEQDEGYLARLLDYFKDINYPLQFFLFPEGTNLDTSSLKRSHSYAEKNGLVKYENVLHPRTTGFIYIVKKLRGSVLDSIHDVTVGYEPNKCFGEKDLVFGNFPDEIHLHIQNYKMADIPVEDEELGQWCVQRWAEKESRLNDFFKDGTFLDKGISEEAQDRRINGNCFYRKMFAISFWTLFLLLAFYGMYHYSLAFWYSIIMIIFYCAITFAGDGVDELQLDMHEMKKAVWNKFKRD